MKIGSLFSGGGLGDYGLELAGMEIAWQVEIDNYCQKILQLRWPDVPKWRDIREVKGSELPAVDLISGGFPCQPFSVAGQQMGKEDDRHLWPEMLRIISEVKPAWVLAENVPGIINLALEDVLNDLEAEGYETLPPLVFPAHALGASHKRDRLWIIANTTDSKIESLYKREEPANETLADSETVHVQGFKDRQRKREFGGSCQWEIEPAVGRVVDGCPNRVDRLKLLGNGQVVQVVQWIGEKIIEFESINQAR